MRKNLIKNIQNFAFQHELWNKNSKILVGVSGGPDSVCLLNVLATLQKKYNLEIHVAHVNYGLRKKDSDADEKFVKLLCKKNDLGLTIFNVSKNVNMMPPCKKRTAARNRFCCSSRSKPGMARVNRPRKSLIRSLISTPFCLKFSSF